MWITNSNFILSVMKTFRIKRYTDSKDGYVVQLGNGTTHTFKNLIKTKAFLAETNRFMTESFVEINEIYLQAFVMWRQQLVLSDAILFDNRCKAALEAAESTLYNSWHKSCLIHGNEISFINQEKALTFIELLIDLLLPKAINRSDTYGRYRLESLKKHIILQRLKLYQYGRTPIAVLDDKENAAALLLDAIYKKKSFNTIENEVKIPA
jgi:hypothetical protein